MGALNLASGRQLVGVTLVVDPEAYTDIGHLTVLKLERETHSLLDVEAVVYCHNSDD